LFGQRSIIKDYAAIIKGIKRGVRRKASHDRPASLAENGFSSFITPAHEVLFADFDWFGATLNWYVRGPWCVEEMRDTLLRDGDDPDLGRRYKVYFNNIELGKLEVGLGVQNFSLDTSAERFRVNRSARIVMDINYLRFVPYTDAHVFLSAIEFLLGSVSDPASAESVQAARNDASSRATAALSGYLWEAFRTQDEYVPAFEHSTEGPYVMFRHTIEHWKAGGLNAFQLEQRLSDD